MKAKKIYVFTIGNEHHASSRIRAINYLPYFKKNGIDLIVLPRFKNKRGNSIFSKIKFFIDKRTQLLKRVLVLLFSKMDKLVVQKIFLSNLELNIIKRRKLPFVFDFDDAIYEDSELAHKESVKMISKAETVFAANETLQNFSLKYNSSTELIPTPTEPFTLDKQENKVCVIGWIGSPWTQHFLKEIEPVFKTLKEDGVEFEIHLVGVKDTFELIDCQVQKYPWYLNCEEHYLSTFDIGVMPLADDKYSRGKSGYKLLMYMSAGIPGVASPVGVNQVIVEDKVNGFLPNDNDEWFSILKELINSSTLREKIGEEGKKKIDKEYTRSVVFDLIKKKIEEL